MNKTLEFIIDYKNKFDKNAIKTYLDGHLIGYVKATDSTLFNQILKDNQLFVQKWGCLNSTSGYMIIQVVLINNTVKIHKQTKCRKNKLTNVSKKKRQNKIK